MTPNWALRWLAMLLLFAISSVALSSYASAHPAVDSDGDTSTSLRHQHAASDSVTNRSTSDEYLFICQEVSPWQPHL